MTIHMSVPRSTCQLGRKSIQEAEAPVVVTLEEAADAVVEAVGRDDPYVQAWEKVKWVKSVKLRP